MISFWILALTLALMAAAFVFVPMRFFASRARVDRTEINVTIHREKLAALEESKAAGEIEGEEFETLKRELEQSLLTDVGDAAAEGGASTQVSSPTVTLVAVAIPIFALLFYAERGYIADVELAEQFEATADAPHGATSMDASLESLYERLQGQPDNDQGWFLLGRSLMTRGRYERAAEAFAHLSGRYPEDTNLIAYHISALYLADGNRMTPRVKQVVDRGLALDPNLVSGLEIVGLDAMQRGDNARAVEIFNRILGLPDIGEERRASLVNLIQRAGGTPSGGTATVSAPAAQPVAPMARPTQQAPAASGGRSVDVLVELADGVSVSPDYTVFVFARAAGGPPMPLAAQRLTVADLPTMVRLDESMAMNPAFSLATASEVEIVARITRAGGVQAMPGDWEASSGTIALEERNPVVKLMISEQVAE